MLLTIALFITLILFCRETGTQLHSLALPITQVSPIDVTLWTKTQLIEIAGYHSITIKKSWTKAQILNSIIA
jgi:hypothetical protein